MTLVVESANVNVGSVEQKVEQKGPFQVMNACSARFSRSAILIEKV